MIIVYVNIHIHEFHRCDRIIATHYNFQPMTPVTASNNYGVNVLAAHLPGKVQMRVSRRVPTTGLDNTARGVCFKPTSSKTRTVTMRRGRYMLGHMYREYLR